jgi:transposase
VSGPASAAAAPVIGAFVAALTAIVTRSTPSTPTSPPCCASTPTPTPSCPSRARSLRAARLLAEIGDCRARFPTPESLALSAGATPSTRQSGQMRTTSFRRSADKQRHDAVCDSAADSRHANPGAPGSTSSPAAAGTATAPRVDRGRAWLPVIWRCWQDHRAYNPARHHALQKLLHEPAISPG